MVDQLDQVLEVPGAGLLRRQVEAVPLTGVARARRALAHVPSTRLPCSSQWAATFLLGCTRGGSPGIFG